MDLESFFTDYDKHLITTSHEQLDQPFVFEHANRYFLVNSIDFVYEEGQAKLHALVDITQEKENERLIIRIEKMPTIHIVDIFLQTLY
ncbi:hypothetical protein [Bacillus sp. B1-b2]|uniref:hypothetical protein n=1 Tax=Bacillus sp. B1-b2 TaxID=2653201 RepID=UPI00186A6D90|nr:hypothetical protein [Bacillus sp. B1-b2]